MGKIMHIVVVDAVVHLICTYDHLVGAIVSFGARYGLWILAVSSSWAGACVVSVGVSAFTTFTRMG